MLRDLSTYAFGKQPKTTTNTKGQITSKMITTGKRIAIQYSEAMVDERVIIIVREREREREREKSRSDINHNQSDSLLGFNSSTVMIISCSK